MIRAVLRTLLRLSASALLVVSLASRAAEEQPSDGDLPSFDVLEFVVEGNTRLAPLDVERAVYPFLGPGKTIEDVEQARSALEKAYQQAGYLTVLVDIPEQKVSEGIVTLNVVEGALTKVRVTGNRYYDAGRILARVEQLREGTVPDFNRVQYGLGTLARVKDRKIVPVLRPGPVPGTVEAELKVEDKLPLHGSLELNNRQTPNTDELRLVTNLRYDNLWQRDHAVSGTFITAPQAVQQLQVIVGSYVAPVGTRGDALAFYGVVSDSEVNVIATSNVIGKGSIVGARYVKALPQKGALTHSLSLGADSKDFKESQPGPGGFETPISYLPFVVEYRVSIARPTRLHSANVGAYTALRSLFGNNEEEFAGKRFGARPNYLYVRGSWTTDQRLGTSSVLRGRIGGQIANQPLITNEQYAAGGADTVRGYLEVERLADRGVQGSLEARRQLAPRSWGKTTLLAFVDAAHLWIIRPQAEQQAEFELYGTGVGMRLEGNRNWNAALDLAVPLADGQVTRKGEPRGHFRVEGRF